MRLLSILLLCFIVFSFTTIIISQIPTSAVCRKKGCECSTGTGIVTPCLNDAVRLCYQRYGRCRRFNGRCGWYYSLTLRNCLTRAGYCNKYGCHEKTCVVDEGNLQPLACTMIYYRWSRCYDRFTCLVNQYGNCEWNDRHRLDTCLVRNGGKPSPR
jgi:hypothetical protein